MCGCRSVDQCWHLTKRQWAEMKALARRIRLARERALELLAYRVRSHLETGTALPADIIEAVIGVEDALKTA